MGRSANILVADDSEDDFLLLERAFRKANPGHKLYQVFSGEIVLEYLDGKPPYSDRALWPLPDLLILDVKMPGAGGFDVLDSLRRRPDLKLPVIVMLSGSSLADDVKRAGELGAAHYFTKPIDFGKLVEVARTMDTEFIGLGSGQ
jgi:CheY-like chemotaxis protein